MGLSAIIRVREAGSGSGGRKRGWIPCMLASQIRFLFFFWLHHVASGILVPQPGTEPASPALEARSLKTLDHVTSPSQGFPDGGKEKTQKLGVKQTRRTKLPSSEMERNATGAGFGDYQELGV